MKNTLLPLVKFVIIILGNTLISYICNSYLEDREWLLS